MDEHGRLGVGAVARLAGVTVRTPHHDDEIGLLRPWTAPRPATAGLRRPTSGGCSESEARAAGLPAGSVEAMEAAEAHRRRIDEAFYPCSDEMQRGLAATYVADPRLSDNDEAISPGLAQSVQDAILANAERHGGRPL